MKKVELNCVSEKLARAISTMKNEEDWNMAKSCIAEAYSVIVEVMEDKSNDLKQMERYIGILAILNYYQEYLDLFHEEANRE